jgi:small GTP-binding protein
MITADFGSGAVNLPLKGQRMTQFTKKICLIGEFAVGKTSLVRRFVESRFDERYLITMGVRISRKVIALAGHHTLNLIIWDTAGGESFSKVVQSYYQGAAGALLVCDLTRIETLAALAEYGRTFRTVCPGASLAVIGNKVDLTGQRAVSDTALAELAGTLGAPWFLGSARTGTGVDPAFESFEVLIGKERMAL